MHSKQTFYALTDRIVVQGDAEIGVVAVEAGGHRHTADESLPYLPFSMFSTLLSLV